MRRDASVAALLALAALAAYLNARLHLTSDGTPHVLTAASWLLRGDADLAAYLGRATFSGRFVGDHFLSFYPPGMPLLIALPLALALGAGADPVDPVFLSVFEKVFGAVATALSVAFVFLACRRLASARAAFLATLVIAPLWIALLTALAWALFGLGWSMLALLASLPLAMFTRYFLEHWRGVVKDSRTFLVLGNRTALKARLLTEGKKLAGEVESIAEELRPRVSESPPLAGRG